MPALHLKFRPKNLDEMVGNTEVVSALKAVLARDPEEIPHAFLFTGPRGCGKTTLARIVARGVKCHYNDFTEVDSADFRGIDTIREIRNRMVYRPSHGPCRVWLLDEIHMATKEAQTALLKALEDTPPHVYLLLATTDPEKLLPTIRDRCSTYTVQTLGTERLMALLTRVCKEIKAKVPEDVLSQIALDATGSARMALVILDKIRDMPKEQMLEAAKQRALEENAIVDLCRLLLNRERNWSTIAKVVKGLDGQEPESIRRAVLAYMTTVLLNSGKENAYLIMEPFRRNFYDSGKPGLAMACYEAFAGQK